MRLYDTHAHFEDSDDIAAIGKRAAEVAVERILAVGGSPELNRNALRSTFRVALGLDRDQLDGQAEALAKLPGLFEAAGSRLAAIGEIGLDRHYGPETIEAQRRLFAAQLELAGRMGLPVVVHTREADDDTLGVLDEVPWPHDTLRGVIHSYTGTPAFAKRLLDRGFAVSFSGIATFRAGENVRQSARYVPDDRIMVETDSPFLAPVPLRGQRCEPAFLVHTARRIADERGVSLEHFAAIAWENSAAMFGA